MIDRASVSALGGALRGIPVPANKVRKSYELDPCPGSPAQEAESAASKPLRTLLERAGFLGTMRLIAAEDSLRVAGAALQEGSAYAVYTLLRTSCELSAKAWWLFEPDIGADERAMRYLSDLWDGLEELRKFPKTVPGVPLTLKDANAAKLAAQEAGLSVRERQTSIPEIGYHGKAAPALLRKMIEDAPRDVRPLGNYIHRALSDFAHGGVFALNSLISSPGDHGGVFIGQHEGNRTYLAVQCGFAVMFHLLAVRRFCDYFGWDCGTWVNQLESIVQLIKDMGRGHLPAQDYD